MAEGNKYAMRAGDKSKNVIMEKRRQMAIKLFIPIPIQFKIYELHV